VVSLIEQLHQAGVQTVMITGDQSSTAEAVARQIRLVEDPVIRVFDSSRFDALSPELAASLIRDVQVFARVNPAQKLQIIQAYQRQGMVVAMTGDGINDGPALRAADVGIAMGLSGTAAAREVADMVLERDNIQSVTTAIYEGRAAYRNLKRALRYFISTHFSDIMFTTAASTMAPAAALPAFRPVQVGLLTDLSPGLALLTEPASRRIGLEPPRDPQAPLFSSRDILGLFSESAVLSGGALAAFGYGLMRYGPGSRAATLAFESLSAGKVLHALTCRPWTSDTPQAASNPANPLLNAALVAALVAQAGTVFIPGLRRLLNIAPLNLTDFAVVGLTAWTTRLINRKIREKRREELSQN
jgi:Ca2+-transporting ATPase